MILAAAVILLAIIFFASVASRWRVPLVVISLFVGMLFGSDGLKVGNFDNYVLAQQIANSALVFVLFIGGFGTKLDKLKSVFGPAMTLATLGVAVTAAVTAFALYWLLKINWQTAMLIGCIIASTDAAAVFSILRSRSLDPKMSAAVEVESATNDPMAIILTTIAVGIASASSSTHEIGLSIGIILNLVWQVVGGVGIGLLVGFAACWLSRFVTDLDKGYFYIYVIAIIMLSFGAADAAKASGILSAFFAGFVLGNTNIPYKSTSTTLLDALSTIGNVVIFVLLGLLVSPKEFSGVFKDGILLFLILALLARPVAVFLCTFWARYSFKEMLFLNWGGLRGAVPIVLATYPAASRIEGANYIFNIVFFAVLLSMLIQGFTITKLADRLKLAVKARSRPRQVMELVALHNSGMELVEIDVADEIYNGEALVSSFRLPRGTTITMINRDDKIQAPTGQTLIKAGDILYVLVRTEEKYNAMEEILRHFRSNTRTMPIVTDYEEVDKRR
ncbi:MAG: potassium/proton antiporter [Chitinispirillales bacterium]|jgi:cell volume regulation protein A|nr:potassium/proton antiporter [Chitinispirillales bacterium]